MGDTSATNAIFMPRTPESLASSSCFTSYTNSKGVPETHSIPRASTGLCWLRMEAGGGTSMGVCINNLPWCLYACVINPFLDLSLFY